MVRPKKHLGQHFLKDKNIASKIVDALQSTDIPVLEIGPGTGVLTDMLIKKEFPYSVIEIDKESIEYLHKQYPSLRIIEGDFLEFDIKGDLAIIGNFPYNISSQIFFHVLDFRNDVKEVVCMLQKEVADRIASKHGNKTYGILSVLLQAYYDIDYLFKVPPGVFYPPPKVNSAVIRLRRNNVAALSCDEVLFKKIIKQGFQNRRKTLRNALKNLNLPGLSADRRGSVYALPVMDKRAEQLSVNDFVVLTQAIEREGERAGTI
ncbi:MAG: 16S rRNA (adenine(1518)-N(6)/adenine(1519)-N(6))-dimethyltransferase RsmA [Bacteroidota bacterium]